MNNKRYLKIKEAAEYAGVTPQTLRNWEQSGKLVPNRHQVNKYRVYDTDELDAVLMPSRTPNRVFILGSGFSRHLTEGLFPVSEALMDAIRSQAHCEALRQVLRDYPDEKNILIFLTHIDLRNEIQISAEQKREIRKELLQILQKQLSVIGLYDQRFDLSKAQRLVKALFRPGDTIILFNWDILLEHLICLNFQEDANGFLFHWGEIFETFIVDRLDTEESFDKTYAGYLSSGVTPNTSQLVTILKPHGSFNFVPTSSSGYGLRPVTDGNTLFFDDSNNRVEGHFVDGSLAANQDIKLFPGINEEKFSMCQNAEYPEFVLPSYIRGLGSQILQKAWQLAHEKVSKATEIVAIGYSFPLEDTLTLSLLNICRGNKFYRILGPVRDDVEQKLRGLALGNPKFYKIYTPEDSDWDNAYDQLIRDLNNE